MNPDLQAVIDALSPYLEGDQLSAAADAVMQALGGADEAPAEEAAEEATEDTGEFDAFKAGQSVFPKE
jgi:hypothetical protein